MDLSLGNSRFLGFLFFSRVSGARGSFKGGWDGMGWDGMGRSTEAELQGKTGNNFNLRLAFRRQRGGSRDYLCDDLMFRGQL